VKHEAAELLNGAASQLQRQGEIAQNGYEQMAKFANEHFTNAASKLGGSIGQLDETLMELQDAITKLGTLPNGHSPQ